MHTKDEYKLKLENTIPFSAEELKQYEKRVGFDYIQAIGELIYAMVTYRPDISFPIIKSHNIVLSLQKRILKQLKKYIDI